jgi:hypothetical protein
MLTTTGTGAAEWATCATIGGADCFAWTSELAQLGAFGVTKV